MSEGSSYAELRDQRPSAIEAATTVVSAMLAKASDGSPDWKTRKEAAKALREYLDNETLLQLTDEVIAEVETESEVIIDPSCHQAIFVLGAEPKDRLSLVQHFDGSGSS